MTNLHRLFFVLAAAVGPALLPAQTYTLEPGRCHIEWTGKAAFSTYSLSGILAAASGRMTLAGGQLTAAAFTLDMRSLDSDIRKLTRHLRSDDFFAVKTYPQAAFRLSGPVPWSGGPVQVKGLLRIRDRELPQRVTVTLAPQPGGYRVTGTAVVDRTRFGIYYNSPSYFQHLKQEAIADEFVLDFELQFVEE